MNWIRPLNRGESVFKVKNNRIVYFAKLSIPLNALIAVGKIFLGIYSLSFFLCINAFYNIGIAVAKYFAAKAHEDSNLDDSSPEEILKKQYAAYRFIGNIVLASSVVYIIYCSKLLFVASSRTHYPHYVAFIIAAVTFTEIAVSLGGAIMARRNNEPVIEAIKLTNFSSSLISLSLTQTAIMSFTYKGDPTFYNGLSGIIFGALAALIGLYMILRTPADE
ncbi:hypothetical protein QP794_12920 [Paenibacillus sp. UMB7766-LJ446]|uniref:hypothetical protein n=1 Tax=Paenibacillus TaxID=44249 RepID=UPI000465FD75|nr:MULTISPECIES: hypothetical protein [Paenibacillus]OPG99926.1 hypothetical protein B2I21_02795 [Chryseobacterium mucoviscidosis]KGP77589.1 hypothetical protein P364_0132510 [Paenibacillus sp. MAEPY2]KGP88360.1 hypothetical protein P363_0106375 [Paenibacillus sp. MAEPY1]MDK8190990.1 hypothetical protein [Paenibacillus sp. UMB7766-LJ446]MDN8589171.1 hypothetical protein [Paenibacillus sp. 11B]